MYKSTWQPFWEPVIWINGRSVEIPIHNLYYTVHGLPPPDEDYVTELLKPFHWTSAWTHDFTSVYLEIKREILRFSRQVVEGDVAEGCARAKAIAIVRRAVESVNRLLVCAGDSLLTFWITRNPGQETVEDAEFVQALKAKWEDCSPAVLEPVFALPHLQIERERRLQEHHILRRECNRLEGEFNRWVKVSGRAQIRKTLGSRDVSP